MTQKELLYLEDAYNHEQNIIEVLNYSTEIIENEDLGDFLENEIRTHENMKSNIKKKLEECKNEWFNYF